MSAASCVFPKQVHRFLFRFLFRSLQPSALLVLRYFFLKFHGGDEDVEDWDFARKGTHLVRDVHYITILHAQVHSAEREGEKASWREEVPASLSAASLSADSPFLPLSPPRMLDIHTLHPAPHFFWVRYSAGNQYQ
jgi:hypothetical protein